MIRTYLTVTLVDKSWRSPGWKSCASLSPSFPQALRKTLRLSWAKNKTRMRFVHLRRQRIISQEFSGRDTAYNSLLPKFISLEGRHGWGGACVQQIRSVPVQSARKHTGWWERLLRDSGWLTAAKLPVGWVLGGDQAKTRKYDIRIIHMSHTRWASGNTNMTHAETELPLTPWNCSLPCTPSPFHVNTCDMCELEAYFGDTGLLQNTRSGDKISFPEASRQTRTGTPCQCFQIVLNLYLCGWFA